MLCFQFYSRSSKCRACYPSEAFEHIRRNVSAYDVIRDVVEEIDRYMVPG